MTKTIVALTFLLVLGLLLPGTSMAQVTVKVGDLGIASDAPFYIGMERGYFKERGIEIKLEKFASAAVMMPPLASGELHVGGGGISPGFFNGLARGMPLKIVAHRSRDMAGFSSNSLMIRTDLKGQINRAADLKGRKVAVNAKGSPLEYMLGTLMESEGLSIKDLDVVYMPWPDMGPALSRKAIDAGTVLDPFVTRYAEAGFGYIWKRAAEIMKDPWDIAVIFYNTDWAEKNPRVARDLMVAYIRGAREYHEYLAKKKGKEEMLGILVKYTAIKDKALYDRMSLSDIDPNGFIFLDNIKKQQDWWVRMGTVPTKVDIDRFTDDRYVKYALEQLGTFPVERR